MINININPQQLYGQSGGSPFGGPSQCCGGNGVDPMVMQMADMVMGMADMVMNSQNNGRPGRGRGMSRSLQNAFGNPEKDEVSIKQNEGKKGQKVPPDVQFKGDARNLPAILQAANSGQK